MLPETVKRLIRAPQFRIKFRVISLLAIDNCWSHTGFILPEQGLADEILERDAAVFARNDGLHLRSAQHDGVIGGLHFPLCWRPRVFNHQEFLARRKRRRRRVAHSNDGVGAHLQLQRSVLQRQLHAISLSLHGQDRVQGIPLRANDAHATYAQRQK